MVRITREQAIEMGVPPEELPPVENKFHNEAATVDGIKFASQREAGHYAELRLRERVGEIRGLQLQVRYPLCVNNELVTTYIADFTFYERLDGAPWWEFVIADSKGYTSREYRFKRKLMHALNGITIREM